MAPILERTRPAPFNKYGRTKTNTSGQCKSCAGAKYASTVKCPGELVAVDLTDAFWHIIKKKSVFECLYSRLYVK